MVVCSANLAWTQTKHAKVFSQASFSAKVFFFSSFFFGHSDFVNSRWHLPEGWIVFGNHVEIRYFCDQFLVGWASISSWSWKPPYLVDIALHDLLSIIEIACFWYVPRSVLKTDIKLIIIPGFLTEMHWRKNLCTLVHSIMSYSSWEVCNLEKSRQFSITQSQV